MHVLWVYSSLTPPTDHVTRTWVKKQPSPKALAPLQPLPNCTKRNLILLHASTLTLRALLDDYSNPAGYIIIPILQPRKLRLREGKWTVEVKGSMNGGGWLLKSTAGHPHHILQYVQRRMAEELEGRVRMSSEVNIQGRLWETSVLLGTSVHTLQNASSGSHQVLTGPQLIGPGMDAQTNQRTFMGMLASFFLWKCKTQLL